MVGAWGGVGGVGRGGAWGRVLSHGRNAPGPLSWVPGDLRNRVAALGYSAGAHVMFPNMSYTFILLSVAILAQVSNLCHCGLVWVGGITQT